MTEYNLTPKTRPVPASSIRVGDVVVQTWEYPVRITQIGYTGGGVAVIRGKYIWQEPNEMDWLLGRFAPSTPLARAVR